MVARNKLVISGNMGTADTWSISMHWAKPSGEAVFGVDALTTWATNIGTVAIPALGTEAQAGLSAQADIRLVEIYEYGATGDAAQSKGEYRLTTPQVGQGSTTHPFYVAAAVSLRTPLPGGRYRGRFYWPAIGLPCDNGRFLNSSGAGGLAEDMADFLFNIADQYQGPSTVRPVIYSAAGNLVTPVTTLLVGNRPDTQRTRQDQLVEVYYDGGLQPL